MQDEENQKGGGKRKCKEILREGVLERFGAFWYILGGIVGIV